MTGDRKARRFAVYSGLAVGVGIATFVLVPNSPAVAHCDTLDGPVVAAAKRAIELRRAEPVLVWVHEEDEQEVQATLKATLAVRKSSAQAKELADTYFYETVVRLHRAGEGEPFTGLKPHGSPINPAISKADVSLKHGNINTFAKQLAQEVDAAIRHRFERVVQASKGKDASVSKGRQYVSAYVEFIHFVEQVDSLLKSKQPHGMHTESDAKEKK